MTTSFYFAPRKGGLRPISFHSIILLTLQAENTNFMNHIGQIISLIVAVLWTVTAIYSDKASHRIGVMSANVARLTLSTFLLAIILWVTIGHPYPIYADSKTWFWLALSAIVGYVFGDWCLFNCYVSIGARLGQLFMTLAPPMAALAGWALLGEQLSWRTALAMLVTLSGIAISILSRDKEHYIKFSLPLKGILLGIGAGTGQGVGLVLSKIGLEHYSAALPAQVPTMMETMLPFASTMIRAIFGSMGFILLIAISKDLPKLKQAARDRKAMLYVVIMSLFGPVVGVSLSLMAVRYTDAGIASTLMALTPVLILFPAAVFDKQKIRFKEILGVTVSMIGVALFFLL